MGFRLDPTFYPSPRLAAESPREKIAYVAALDPRGALPKPGAGPDALAVVDVDPLSAKYGQLVSLAELPNVGNEQPGAREQAAIGVLDALVLVRYRPWSSNALSSKAWSLATWPSVWVSCTWKGRGSTSASNWPS